MNVRLHLDYKMDLHAFVDMLIITLNKPELSFKPHICCMSLCDIFAMNPNQIYVHLEVKNTLFIVHNFTLDS